MIIYTIYKVVNKINGKVYIGFDSNWPNRQRQHIYNSNCKSTKYRKHKNFKIYHAFRKYGVDNFEWQIVYQSQDRLHTLEMEQFFIKDHDSFKCGYNMTYGGEGSIGKTQSEVNKKKQSELRTKMNLCSRWYNNGKKNSFSVSHPGDGWIEGRLNQKPSTNGRKWFNNGHMNKLCIESPGDGWCVGMLRVTSVPS